MLKNALLGTSQKRRTEALLPLCKEIITRLIHRSLIKTAVGKVSYVIRVQ
jgi:hypothetical protein